MKPGTCADCGELHDPRERCSPGRARASAIAFPRWASGSQCERLHDGSLTEHGRRMAALRDRGALATPAPATPTYKSRHFGRRIAS